MEMHQITPMVWNFPAQNIGMLTPPHYKIAFQHLQMDDKKMKDVWSYADSCVNSQCKHSIMLYSCRYKIVALCVQAKIVFVVDFQLSMSMLDLYYGAVVPHHAN
jgi:hypothetical protein